MIFWKFQKKSFRKVLLCCGYYSISCQYSYLKIFSKMKISRTRDFFVKFFERSDMKTGTGSGTRSGTKFSKKVTCLRTHNFSIFDSKKLLNNFNRIYLDMFLILKSEKYFLNFGPILIIFRRQHWSLWENLAKLEKILLDIIFHLSG